MYQAAESFLRELPAAAMLPDVPISDAHSEDSRLRSYGYRYWTDLFNARQRVHLALLLEAVREIDDQASRRAVSIAVSNHLTTNCMMTSYARAWRRLTPLFGIREFRHVTTTVEINPWFAGTGRGTFPNALRAVQVAQRSLGTTKEFAPQDAERFKSIKCPTPCSPPIVQCGDARDLKFISDRSINVVLTDPPYFDNIPYAQLAEFFSPWLGALKVLPDRDEGARSAIRWGSIGADRRVGESSDLYTDSMRRVFAEIARILRDDGALVFSFRHSRSEAWLSLGEALLGGGWRATQVLPVPGEAGFGPHVHPGTALWDAVFVLRKSLTPQPAIDLDARLVSEGVAARVADWDTKLSESTLRFGAADRLVLTRALALREAINAPECDRETLRGILRASEERIDAPSR